ncbi:hypothetical protein TIFTF001_011119 [Ficus carica]|uniref:GOLD domain-containing protein n=1 Tax=Ficus carica TaxID=3494 RepID=A0AA88D3Y7_FICCA|nr:hypothetical protein TIFTF001_011119 [Ficus carica]
MIQSSLAISLLVLVLLLLGFLSSTSESLQFELQSGHSKCISEDIKSNSMTVGKYSVVNHNEGHPLPETHKITVRVTSHYGNSYHYSENAETGQFAFVAAEAGDYMACFFAADHQPQITLTIEFDWKSGIAAKDWTNVAKKGTVDMKKWKEECLVLGVMRQKLGYYGHPNKEMLERQAMELELKRLQDTVTSIHEEMFYLREREEEMQELNKTTNSRMAWLSFLSLFVSLSVAGLQLWHLKTFFEKKKLI